jgi:DNA polymerase-3 subunit gamma/tau
MSYQVLARKLRPARFADLVGQDHVVRALTHALEEDRLHHAYLFTGTRGVGKTTIARILARSLNCERGVSANPCGECSICTEVLENRFVDLIEVDAASRTGVDDTRELLDNAQYLPTRGRYKVYLVDEVHMLSKHAFNALLKTLEEPPEHVKFLLATTDPKKVPVTVLSRCLQFQLKNLPASVIVRYLGSVLQEEGIEHDEAALERIASSARGSMRDALSLTDQAIAFGGGQIDGTQVDQMLGVAGRNEVQTLVAALASGAASQVLSLVGELAERSVDFTELLTALIEDLHRQAVTAATGVGEPGPFDPETVQLNYQIALMGLKDLDVVPDPQLGFEMTVLRMLAFAPAGPDTAVAAPSGGGAAAGGAASTGAPADTATGTQNAGAVRAARSAPAARSEPQPAAPAPSGPAVTVPAELAEHWYELVASLPLTGVNRLLVDHALPQSNAPEDFRLVLDEDHDMLMSEAQRARVERALAERLGTRVALTIKTGVLAQETPAARSARLRRERQAAARTAVEADPTVQQLLKEFGGELKQVKPLEEGNDPA